MSGAPWRLRPATEADKEYVAALNERCYRPVVTAQFGRWDEREQRERFDRKWQPERYQVIIVEEVPAGVLSVCWEPDHVFLSGIQVDPDFQGRGIGTGVVEALCAEARAKALPVRLQVLCANRAQALYLRLGFRVTGTTETHVLMERRPPYPFGS